MIDLLRLERFVMLAQIGSFSKAAKKLHISQPALSRSIRELEISYGASLFDRDRSGTVTTPAGKALLSRSLDLFQRAKLLERQLYDVSTGMVGEAVFGLGTGVATALLPQALEWLFEQKSRITVRCIIGSSDMMIRQLLDGEIEFFVGRLDGVSTPRLASEGIGQISPRYLVRREHPLVGRTVVDPADLEAFPRMSSTAWNYDVESRLGIDVPEGLKATIEIDSFGVMIDTALRTDAVVLASFSMGGDRLVELPILEPGPPVGPFTTIALHRVAGRQLTPAGQLVHRLIRDAGRQVLTLDEE